MTPTGGRSGHPEIRLGSQPDRWAERDGHALAFGPATGFLLPDGTVRAGRCRVAAARSLGGTRSRTHWMRTLRPCPAAAFEIPTKATRPADLRVRMRVYLAHGARIAVFIDLYGGTAEVYRAGRKSQSHDDPTTLPRDPELEGFLPDL